MNTMKLHIYRLAFSLTGIIALSACTDEYFDTEMGGRIDPSQHYNSLLDAEFSYAGCFVFLQDIAENMVLVDGLRSDLLTITDNADREMIDIYRHEISATNGYLDPSNFYKMIININEVIPNLSQILEKDRDFDSAYYESLTGALITLRSWAYFTLAKLNGEVGLVNGNLSSINPSEPIVYLSKEALIDQLISELLPYYDPEDISRFDMDHYVLLGELYLEKNDYANAIKYLKFAIDGPAHNSTFMVNADYKNEAWQNIFLNSINQFSTVFTAVPYSYVDGQANKIDTWMNYEYYYRVKPSNVIVNAFLNEVQQANAMGDVYRGMGVTIDTTPDGEYWVKKYSLDFGIPFSADVILYRAADVHLLLAEALNRNGDSESALVLMNNGFGSVSSSARPSEFVRWARNNGVRGRVYLKAKTVPNGTANVVEYVEDLIIQERAQELAFEGKRWFDLVRIANRRNDPSYLANKVAAKYTDPETAAAIKSKLMNPANWYIPISKIN